MRQSGIAQRETFPAKLQAESADWPTGAHLVGQVPVGFESMTHDEQFTQSADISGVLGDPADAVLDGHFVADAVAVLNDGRRRA